MALKAVPSCSCHSLTGLSRVNSDAQMVMVVDRMAPLDELPGAGVDVGMLVAIYQNFELNERIRTFQIFMC